MNSAFIDRLHFPLGSSRVDVETKGIAVIVEGINVKGYAIVVLVSKVLLEVIDDEFLRFAVVGPDPKVDGLVIV